jgi:rRNA maturation protein Nop10
MALKGCPECGTSQMIASPTLGTCDDCGSHLVVLPRE